MTVLEVRHLKELEHDNAQLKQIVVDLTLDHRISRDVNQKSGEAVGAPSPRHQQLRELSKARYPDLVWSNDFIFERTEDGRILKFLTIVNGIQLGCPIAIVRAFTDWISRHQDAGDAAPLSGSNGLPAQ